MRNRYYHTIITVFLLGLLYYQNDYGQRFHSSQKVEKIFLKVKKGINLQNEDIVESFKKMEKKYQLISILPTFQRLKDSKHLKNIYTIEYSAIDQTNELISALEQLPYVIYAEEVPDYHIFYDPNDPALSAAQWNVGQISAPEAWDLNTGCSEVIIAITDDAVLTSHEDLADKIVGGYDVSDNDSDPNPPSSTATADNFSHGTHVAAIAAASTDNGLGLAGSGFNAMIMPIKCKPSATAGPSLPDGYLGIEYAIDNGADVINMSWGGSNYSATYEALMEEAYDQGIVCIAAAGNDNVSIPMYPASYNHVINVGATNQADSKASFSNYGATIDVMAPGVGIYSCVAGAGGANDTYDDKSGTSMASPLVAGVAALMLCHSPGSTPDMIEDCLKSSCDNVDAQNSSYIGEIGAGRVNAFEALLCLQTEPLALFELDYEIACIGQAIQFTDISAGIDVNEWAWEFPGGSPATSTEANPMVTYSANGEYTITLTATNEYGSDSVNGTVLIQQPSATINGTTSILPASSTMLYVSFEGTPPYSFTYTDGTNNFSFNDIYSNPYFFSVTPDEETTYNLVNYSDGFCEGLIDGEAIISIGEPSVGLDCTFGNIYGSSEPNAFSYFDFNPLNNEIFCSGNNPDLAKFSGDGELLWSKSYTGTYIPTSMYQFKEAPNGDLILGRSVNGPGASEDYFVMRVDNTGMPIWTKTYDTGGNDRFGRLTKSLDDSYIVVGWNSLGSGDDSSLIRIDENGDVIWSKSITYGEDDQLYDLVSDGMGGCVIVGGSIISGNSVDIFLVNIDVNGDWVWGREYSGLGINPHEFPYCIANSPDGGYVIGGENWQQGAGAPSGKDGFVLKIDSDLEVEWLQKFDNASNNEHRVQDIVCDNDGNVYATGYAWIDGQKRALILKYSPSGELLWTKVPEAGNSGRAIHYTDPLQNELLYTTAGAFSDGFGEADILMHRWTLDLEDACYLEDKVIVEKTEPFVGSDWNPGLVNMTVNSQDVAVNTEDYALETHEECGSCCEVESQFAASDTTICVGDTISFINFSALANDYDWQIEDVNFSNDDNPSYQFLEAGVFRIDLIANNAGICSDSSALEITVLDGPIINISADQTICQNGSVQLEASGGISYEWSPIDGLSDPYIANPIASPSATTEYTVTVDNGSTCLGTNSVLVTVGPNAAPIPNFTIESSYCEGDLVNIVNNSIAGPDAIYEWTFSNGTPDSHSGENPPAISFPQAGVYPIELIISDPLCGNTILVQNANFFPPPIVFAGNDTSICVNEDISGLIDLGETGITYHTYLWEPGIGLSDSTIADPTLDLSFLSESQQYILTVTNTVSECINKDTLDIILLPISEEYDSIFLCTGEFHTLPNGEEVGPGEYSETYTAASNCDSIYTWVITQTEINLDAEDTYTINLGESIELPLLVDSNVDSLSYEWSPTEGLSCTDCLNPIASPTETTIYTITINSGNGCTISQEITVEVLIRNQVAMPNAFTPNGDGINDLFRMSQVNIASVNCAVFNRWGQVVFQSNDLDFAWDGSFKGEDLDVGVYVYFMEVVFEDGETLLKKGNVSLIR